MATAAMLILKPFKNFASSTIVRSFGFGNNNKLVLLHTGNNPKHTQHACEKIASLKKADHNLLVINDETNNCSEENFQVIYKGSVKTGIIKATPVATLKDMNQLSSFLKKEKKCQLVICLSSLGYKNKNGLDDVTLAERSSHIDIIIGNHATNHTTFPVVARNHERSEVIIHHAANNGFGLGNIEIEFDERTSSKRLLAIDNLLTRLPKTA
jgi:2',3'-cyclic-nucleotide 2'-phosphodiesterase (5'-nucleotidase family)